MSFELNGTRYDFQSKLGAGKQGDTFLYKSGSDLFTVKVSGIFSDRQRNSIMRETEVLRSLLSTCGPYPCLIDAFILDHNHDLSQILLENLDLASLDDYPKNISVIIYRFVPGIPLSKLLKETPRLNVAESLVTQILEILVELHSRKVAHRDVKPDNIIYNPDTQRFSLIDFGLSCQGSDCSGIVGTANYFYPKYLSREEDPESLRDYQTTDIYGLGATVYSYLHHHLPYKITGNSEGWKIGNYREFTVDAGSALKAIVEMMIHYPETSARDLLQRWQMLNR